MNSVVLFRHSHSGTFRLAAWAAQFKNSVEAKRVCAHLRARIKSRSFEEPYIAVM
jgi:hypothetical protein